MFDESFPAAKCFKRIVIFKGNDDPIQRLMKAEKKVLEYISDAVQTDTTYGQVADLIESTLVDISGFQEGGNARLVAFLDDEMIGENVDSETYMQYADQRDILETHILDHGKSDYICVALDSRNLPLYWILFKTIGTLLYLNGFAKSVLSILMDRYQRVQHTYAGCGAPFLSYVVDKIMCKTDRPYFFVTAMTGTRKTLATIEGVQGKPRQLKRLDDGPVDYDTYKAVTRHSDPPEHVYFPTEAFRNAWKRAVSPDESTKRAKCIACGMNPAKWYMENKPDHVFCREECCF